MWQGIVGHDRVVEGFRKSVASGRMASSYLLLGPEGVGKRSFALQLAKTIFCPQATAEQFTACGKCESCLLAAAGNHPDLDQVALLPGKRWLGVDQFLGDREHRNQEGLCHNISLRPILGRRRIAIIDDADRLTTESSNCLLKTLEEPPAGSVLILLGTVRSRQLPTILSRTQVVRFASLAPEQIAQILLDRGIETDPDVARQRADAARGTLQGVTDQLELGIEDFRPRLLASLRTEKLHAGRIAGMVQDFLAEAGSEAEAKRKRLRAVVQLVTEYFASELKGCACERLSPLPRVDGLLVALERCFDVEENIDRNANQATLVECWLDDLELALVGIGNAR